MILTQANGTEGKLGSEGTGQAADVKQYQQQDQASRSVTEHTCKIHGRNAMEGSTIT
jgi:hypothetical protein